MRGLTRDEAVALCARVREQGQAMLSTPDRRQCWRCQQESQGDPDRMYIARSPGFLGCDLVNKLRARSERARST